MNIERVLENEIALHTDLDVAVVDTDGAVSVTLEDTVDVNTWMRESVVSIRAQYASKGEAHEASEKVLSLLAQLHRLNGINGASVSGLASHRMDSRAMWTYTIVATVRHRR